MRKTGWSHTAENHGLHPRPVFSSVEGASSGRVLIHHLCIFPDTGLPWDVGMLPGETFISPKKVIKSL